MVVARIAKLEIHRQPAFTVADFRKGTVKPINPRLIYSRIAYLIHRFHAHIQPVRYDGVNNFLKKSDLFHSKITETDFPIDFIVFNHH